jgi:serpin B
MGIISAFSGSANFSGISDTSLFINMLKHVTNISVDKKGIEAAAATITGMVGSNIDTPVNYRTIRVDHPFAFIIRDIKTNSILFIGAVNKI